MLNYSFFWKRISLCDVETNKNFLCHIFSNFVRKMIIIAECFQQIMKNNASSSDDDGDVDVKVEVEAVDARQRDKVEEPLWSVGDLQPDEEVWLLNVPSHVSLNMYPGKPCCEPRGSSC